MSTSAFALEGQVASDASLPGGPPARRARLPVVAVAVAVLALTGVFVAVRAVLPSDSTETAAPADASDGVSVSPLGHGSGLRRGDVVVAVNGKSIAGRSLPRARAGEHLTYQVRRGGSLVDVPVTLGHYPIAAALAANWATLLLAGSLLAVAAFVVRRRPDDSAGRVLVLASCLFACGATSWVLDLQVIDLGGGLGWRANFGGNVAYALFLAAVLQFALVFPVAGGDRRRRRRLAALAYVLVAALYAGWLAFSLPRAASPLQRSGVVIATAQWSEYVVPVLVVVGMAYTYRGADEPARRRLRWVTVWIVTAVLVYLVLFKVPSVLLGRQLAPPVLEPLVFVPVPLALAVAIVHRRLFDIDVVVRRSLIYASLTVFVVGSYVGLVAAFGSALHPGNDWIALVTTGLVALAFSPLRSYLHRGVSRLLYGHRDDPGVIISRLGERLERPSSPGDILPGVVDTLADTLHLPYVAIELAEADGIVHTTAHGEPRGADLALPLLVQGQVIGRLVVAERSPGEGFARADRRTLERLAAQVGAAAQAVRLAEDLQRSRERLVTAVEDERRRLRRELHDGLGPALAAATLQLRSAQRFIDADPGRAKQVVGEVSEQVQATIGDIRRLVYGLRPPALDQLGLVTAVREHASRFSAAPEASLEVAVETRGDFDQLPAAVEVAAYRIVCEALANAQRHAEANRCAVRLVRDGALDVEVVDDGHGLPATHRSGVGMTSMRERAAEIGGWCTIGPSPSGGTLVRAHLPLSPS